MQQKNSKSHVTKTVILCWPSALCLSRLVACLSPRRSGCNTKPVFALFVLNQLALGQIIPRVLGFSAIFIPPVLLCLFIQRRATASTLPKLIALFHVLFACKCVLYCCHRVSTQLQLTNIYVTHALKLNYRRRRYVKHLKEDLFRHGNLGPLQHLLLSSEYYYCNYHTIRGTR